MAKSKPTAREGLKIPLPVLIVVVVVGAAVWIWLANREVVEPTPTWSDTEAGTTPIQERLENFRSSWNAADLDAIRTMSRPADIDDPDEEPLLDRRIRQNGWGAGLPMIGDPAAERKDAERYTVTWPVDGVDKPMITYWEWHDRAWFVVSWIIPRVE